MKSVDVKRLGLILSVQATIEGMKAENKQREQFGDSMAFRYDDFKEKAAELENLSYAPEHEL